MNSEGTAVTRRDFYSAITVIWMFIMFIILKLYIAKSNDPSWRDYVVFGAALGGVLVHGALSFREVLRSRKIEARGFPIEPKQSGDSTDI